MASNRIPLKINVRQNQNNRTSSYQKFFPEVERVTTLSTRGMAEHMKAHGTVYTLDVVEGVLRKLATCIPELVGQGTAVKIDGLGTFFPTAEGVKGGIEKEKLEGFNPDDYVAAIHVRFLPEGTSLDNITSRVFKEKVELEGHCVVETAKKTIGGKVAKVRTLTPIADWVKKQKEVASEG